jgi:hypothetical protein
MGTPNEALRPARSPAQETRSRGGRDEEGLSGGKISGLAGEDIEGECEECGGWGCGVKKGVVGGRTRAV